MTSILETAAGPAALVIAALLGRAVGLWLAARGKASARQHERYEDLGVEAMIRPAAFEHVESFTKGERP